MSQRLGAVMIVVPPSMALRRAVLLVRFLTVVLPWAAGERPITS